MKFQNAVRVAMKEWFLAVSVATSVVFALFGADLFADFSNGFWLATIFSWLFVAILGSALAVVRHADHLAEALGEPFGTLILTLSVTTIEIMTISAVMLGRQPEPTLVRDTLFAVVMIILAGVAGLSLLLGGWRHREQPYNLQGANAYLSVIIPLAVLTLTLPNFTVTTSGQTLSLVQQLSLGLMSVGLYCVFLAIQTGRHRQYFVTEEGAKLDEKTVSHAAPSTLMHTVLLVAYMAPVAFLAEELAHPIDYLIDTSGMPAAIGGVIIALLVATPEAMAAIRAALANRMQQSVNVFLGSILCTIGLTVPAMLVISHVTGRAIILGLPPANDVLLILTLAVSVVTFTGGRTNVLQGAVHALLFAAFLLLTFQA